MNTERFLGAAPPLSPVLEPVEPQLRDALNHPARRDILRALAVASSPRDLATISRSVLSGSCTLHVLGYHAQVLERADLAESVRGSASGAPRFALSARAERTEVLGTLRETEGEDRIAGFRALVSGAPARSEGS